MKKELRTETTELAQSIVFHSYTQLKKAFKEGSKAGDASKDHHFAVIEMKPNDSFMTLHVMPIDFEIKVEVTRHENTRSHGIKIAITGVVLKILRDYIDTYSRRGHRQKPLFVIKPTKNGFTLTNEHTGDYGELELGAIVMPS